MVTTTVGTPAASRRRASTGTLRQQSGQTGASTTPSTPSPRATSTISGAVAPAILEPRRLVPHHRDMGRCGPPTIRSATSRFRARSGSATSWSASTSSGLTWRCVISSSPWAVYSRDGTPGRVPPRWACPLAVPVERRLLPAVDRPAEDSNAIVASANRGSNGAHTPSASPGSGTGDSNNGRKLRGQEPVTVNLHVWSLGALVTGPAETRDFIFARELCRVSRLRGCILRVGGVREDLPGRRLPGSVTP